LQDLSLAAIADRSSTLEIRAKALQSDLIVNDNASSGSLASLLAETEEAEMTRLAVQDAQVRENYLLPSKKVTTRT